MIPPKLIVLGPNFKGYWTANSTYKGRDRNKNPRFDTGSKVAKKKLNAVFEEFLEHTDLMLPDGGYITDINLANKIAEVYTKYDPEGGVYEVFEIVYPFEEPKLKNTFLGYDILLGHMSSMIAYLLNTSSRKLATEQSQVKSLYESKLNEHLLFSDLNTSFSFYKIEDEILKDYGSSLSILGIYA